MLELKSWPWEGSHGDLPATAQGVSPPVRRSRAGERDLVLLLLGASHTACRVPLTSSSFCTADPLVLPGTSTRILSPLSATPCPRLLPLAPASPSCGLWPAGLKWFPQGPVVCGSLAEHCWLLRAQPSGCLWHVPGGITTLPVPLDVREGADPRNPSLVPCTWLGCWGLERGPRLQALGTSVSARGLAFALPMKPSWTLGCLFYSCNHSFMTPPMSSAAATVSHCAPK